MTPHQLSRQTAGRRPADTVRTVSSSDGTYLRFLTNEEHAQFEREEEDLRMRAYHRQRQRHGVWASNQDKFVPSPELLNQLDNRAMEDRYSAWIARNPNA